ncbi:MAG: LysM peptidoglycan-binding domain-containing protein [Spirochaetaceae bacterium]|jgi:nucleoid-associated protein YgaU|nr:LysM peptidoglycan-binding domain-containing protein [Spirochaetaceae bacterium]
MKHKALLLLPALFLSALGLFAQAEIQQPSAAVPGKALDNDYYLQSLRYTGLARYSYETGDYDASTAYAEEAMRYARLSDGYVADQALLAARNRIYWASSAAVNAPARYPRQFGEAEAALADARERRDQEDFSGTVAAANRVYAALEGISAVRPAEQGPDRSPAALPATYTVRDWASSRDCLWNIAGRPWAYGDSRKWRLLYDANRSRLPEPDNPNLIEPGMVLEIPSVQGETRRGLWSPGTVYPPLR